MSLSEAKQNHLKSLTWHLIHTTFTANSQVFWKSPFSSHKADPKQLASTKTTFFMYGFAFVSNSLLLKVCFLVFQGAFSGIIVGFCVSMWLAIGSTFYPPSEETMGVLHSFIDRCGPSNITLNSSPTPDQHSISVPLLPNNQGSVSSLSTDNVINCH